MVRPGSLTYKTSTSFCEMRRKGKKSRKRKRGRKRGTEQKQSSWDIAEEEEGEERK